MPDLDPRLNAFRPDLAAEKLKGRVEAERFTAGRPAQVVRGVADLKRAANATARLDSQLLSGEVVTVYDETDSWAWVQNHGDDYVGYVAKSALSDIITEPNHSVSVVRTFVFPEPDIKAPPLDCLSMSGQVIVTGEKDGFSEIASGGWVYSRHLATLSETDPDYVATAHRFMGVPYLWGGKESLGIDCSGLVQVVLARAGIACLRDSYMQAESLGEAVDWKPGKTELQRGDFIYFPGHVAISLGGSKVIHANAKDLMVAIEELAPVVARVEQESGGHGIIALRRLIQNQA